MFSLRCTMNNRYEEPLIRAEYADDPAEYEVQLELRRLGIQNQPCPDVCPKCGGELKSGSGMVGETVIYCDKDGCEGFMWEDSEDAIRRVY